MAGLGDLVIKLHADMAQFTSDMGRAAHVSEREWRKVRRHASDAATAITAGAAIASAAVIKVGTDALKAADDLYKMSQKVGVSVESLSGLQYAAKLSDVSVESLGTGLRMLAKNMQDTAAGTGEARLAFAALNMTATTTGGTLKTTEGALLEIADKFADMEDGAGKTALAMKLFGRAGADMIPLLNQGAAGLKANAEEAKRFGLVISTDAAKKAEEFNDQLTRIKESLKGFSLGITMEALPSLARFIEQLIEGTRIAGGFWAAVGRFGLGMSPFKDPAEQIQAINARMEELRGQRARAIEQGRPGLLPNIDAALEEERQRLEFAKLLQRQGAPTLPPGARDETARYGKPKKAAPMLPDEAAIKKAQDDARRTYELIAAGEEEFQKESAAAWGFYWKMHVDEQQKALQTEADRLKAWFALIDKEQEDAIAQGAVLAQDVTDNHKKLEEQQNRNADAARRFGLTMSSALEDAIANGAKFSDVLQAITKDLAAMITRMAITEPLAGGISELLKPLGKGVGSFFSGLIPSFDTGTPYVPRDTLAMVHKGEAIIPASENRGGGGNINVTLNVGSLDPRTAAHVILANEGTIKGMFRRAAKWRGDA